MSLLSDMSSIRLLIILFENVTFSISFASLVSDTVLTISNQAVKMSDSAIMGVVSAFALNCSTLELAPWAPSGAGAIDLGKELSFLIRAGGCW